MNIAAVFDSRFGMALTSAAIASIWTVPAVAQSYPSKPIEFVVHTSPGGGTDVFTRAVTEIITRDKLLPQSVTVANRTGGGAVASTYIHQHSAVSLNRLQ